MPNEDIHPPIEPEQMHLFQLPDKTFDDIQKEYATLRHKYFEDLHLNTKPLTPTPEQVHLVAKALELIPKVLAAYGITNPDLLEKPLPKIFFLNRKDFYTYALQKEYNSHETITTRAVYQPAPHVVFIYFPKGRNRNERDEEFLHTSVHELIHALGLRRLQVYKKESDSDFTIGMQRTGLRINAWGNTPRAGKFTDRFHDLNEAITEDLAIEITNIIINALPEQFHDAITDQIRVLLGRTRLKTHRTLLVKEKAEKLKRHGVLSYAELVDRIARSGYPFNIDENMFKQSYPKERKRFYHIIDALSTQTGKTELEIKTMFFRAYFVGSLRELGEIVDGTLGKGTIHLIADDYFGNELTKRIHPKKPLINP